ncbi:toll/interleukin-1 receptor domain-containing protein [Clostridium sp.]|uniref:toll/interleukin-1 receptor domain-containing protein n=1 Tax=Clostridium sp. TaxID=1506 RepID=UPI001DC4758C|nr:toll/interleukin-1 receptor domain-containing protein [Clostridium sp.]MBS5940010.1 toll/interleukin-1 receptor domain-containing protein [Clostridium sp.]
MKLKAWIQYIPIKWRNNLNYVNFANYANISERDAERFFYEIYEEKYLFLKFQIRCPICKQECWINENSETIFNCNNCESDFDWKEHLEEASYTYVANMELLANEKKKGKSMSPIGLFKEKIKKSSDNVIELKEIDNKNDGIKIFFSYSHVDEKMRNELEKHLVMLKRQGVISTWHDRKIMAGSELDSEIDENLKDADIILLLVSVDFLSSDYCYDIEVKQALEMHKNNKAIVIPVILRSCDWSDAPFSKLMALPTDAKSVSTWDDKDEAFLNIAIGIKEVAKKLNKR